MEVKVEVPRSLSCPNVVWTICSKVSLMRTLLQNKNAYIFQPKNRNLHHQVVVRNRTVLISRSGLRVAEKASELSTCLKTKTLITTRALASLKMSGAGSTHHNVRSISSIPDTDSVRSTSRPVSRTESSRFENDIHRPSLPRVVNNDERPSTAGSARFNKESIPFHRPTPSQAMPKRPENSKQKRNDEYVMDTNNSSIVSKRSVEKLYYGGEQEYFRYFVSKFKRRSPLINRGYWLRMKAIDSTVQRFLSEQTHKRKIVVNLGCG